MAGNRIVFLANTAEAQREVWLTDGTTQGTVLAGDIYRGPSYGSEASSFVDLGNGRMVFAATADAVNGGRELWVTDGTAKGTKLLKDLYPGAGNGAPVGLVPLGNGKVLFGASDSTGNGKIWTTDGTAAGTTLVTDIFSASNGNSLGNFTRVGDKVAFTALDFAPGRGNVLWISDGSAAGTKLLHVFGNGGSASNFTDLGNGRMVFLGTEQATGGELWFSDGTEAGTALVKDIATGGGTGLRVSADSPLLALGNGRAIFRGNDGTSGDELWSTDGTAEGTVRLADIAAGANGANPANFQLIEGGKALFAASNGTSYGQLWVTDGTAEGTVLVKDFGTGLNGYPTNFFRLPDGRVLFSGQTGAQGRELWITDGTSAGTVMVKDIASGSASSSPGNFALLDKTHVVFSADGELWTSDGTADGTRLVVDLTPGFNNSTVPGNFTSLGNGQVTFVRNVDATNGTELWITDGTAEGTRLLKDIYPGVSPSSPGPGYLLLKEQRLDGTSAGEIITGAALDDTINGLAGNDTLIGRGGRDVLVGGKGDDTLLGGSGNDVLRGGLGRDILTGGTGKDAFVFDTVPENDRVTDFDSAAGDTIRLSRAVFAGFAATGTLSADAFVSGGGVRAARDADDRLAYDTATGVLWYDADGAGGRAAVAIARFGGSVHPVLAVDDILIVA